jgi:hypothetical protein
MKIELLFFTNMSGTDNFLYPSQWRKIVRKYRYPFCPRMILIVNGEFIWQCAPNKQLNISHWKLEWFCPNTRKKLLMTYKEFDEYSNSLEANEGQEPIRPAVMDLIK